MFGAKASILAVTYAPLVLERASCDAVLAPSASVAPVFQVQHGLRPLRETVIRRAERRKARSEAEEPWSAYFARCEDAALLLPPLRAAAPLRR